MFLERLHAEHPDWTRAQAAPTKNWLTMPSPLKGTHYSVSFASGGRIRTELYIDSGDGEENSELLRVLQAKKSTIEAVHGSTLSWEDLPGRRACRIADYAHGDVNNTDQHDAYIDWFLDAGTRLRRAFAAVD
jgi:Domain of unknown function (DUF4268)